MIRILLFAVKRTLKMPLFWIFLAAIIFLPPLMYSLGRHVDYPPAAYVVADTDDSASLALASYLKKAGFTAFETEESMAEAVARGQADAGVYIPADVSTALQEGTYRSLLRFYISPTTAFADLWREHAITALFSIYAPYISADLLEDLGIPEEEMLATYQALMQKGKLFSFTISTRKGRLIQDVDRSRRFFFGALSLVLFISTYFCISAPLMESVRRLAPRIGRGKAFISLYLPGLLLRSLALWGGACAAAALSGEKALAMPLLAYIGLLLVFHLLLSLLPGEDWKLIFLFFLTVFALALLPIYMDFSLILPLLGQVRMVLPPYWLWMLAF